MSGFTLHPIVGITDRRPAFRAAPDEVEEILEVSLDDLRDASRIRQGTRIREGVAVEYPYFDLLGHQVWGATAMVLGEFICLLGEQAAREPPLRRLFSGLRHDPEVRPRRLPALRIRLLRVFVATPSRR